MHLAAGHHHVELMQLLLEAGAEMDAPSTENKMSPLHVAAERDCLEPVRFLVEKGAQKNLREVRGSQDG